MAENTNKPIYVISADTVEGLMAAVKRVQLKNEFVISRDAIYDYYSTNSGIFAANPTLNKKSGGGGDDPADLDRRLTVVEGDMDKTKQAVSNAAEIVAPVPETIPEYDDIDEITGATITLKRAVVDIDHTLNS